LAKKSSFLKIAGMFNVYLSKKLREKLKKKGKGIHKKI